MPLLGTVLLALGVTLFGRLAIAEQQVLPCPDMQVEIHAEQSFDAELVCAAAADAVAFLANLGLTQRSVIVIEMADHALIHYGSPSFGSFDQRSGRISLMSIGSIRSLDSAAVILGQRFDPQHYRSVVAHEIAHALFHQNAPDAELSNAAQEYLAYVTQLAALPDESRVQLIKSAGVEGWQSGDAISEVYMALAPEKFAVKSYLHFTAMSDPSVFVKTLLNVKWFYVHVP